MNGTNKSKARELAVLSRRAIEDHIARGHNIVILNGDVLNCNAWMPYHPGGDQAIRHMVGRDATDEITAYVLLYSRSEQEN
jgi:delta8-fatty-acid desaturase